MLNSVAVGRRLALRAAAYQLLAVGLVAALFLLRGLPQALAAALGGLAMLAGGLVAARLALGGGVIPAGAAMLRLLAGVVLKWAVVFAVLLVGLGAWKLPPLPLMAGLLTGLAAQVLAAARRQ
ncbi:hypothetical protein SAMN06296416_10846 [Pseudoxanthomonas wuyuanensis]|uniref:ATP synthase I chain n=1 Tax=Pseudoxanthomonas wuyuanensis TaxID=1073196 RepID=A0A286DB15_9GAMM|nr:hypothetical protein [Pseudoxanthomonas wuyuanensis]SOD55849.1 hypothetical protein SAMN06296416_10846 [Pseudoxanthomonas wuyuanensis]